jgi:hypothetical protein
MVLVLRPVDARADVAPTEPTQAPSSTVLLVSADEVVARALARSLEGAGGRVVRAPAPVAQDPSEAQAAAASARAGYVVWVSGGTAVVYRRDAAVFVQRPIAAGPLDDAGAASVALTIRTALQLPARSELAPIAESTPTPPPEPPRLRRATSPRWGLALQLGVSAPRGGSVGGGQGRVRIELGRELGRPGRRAAWQSSVAVDLGPTAAARASGADVRWFDAGVAATVAWQPAVGKLRIGPELALGARWSSVEATAAQASARTRGVAYSLGIALAVAVDVPGRITPVARLGLSRRWGDETLTLPRGNSGNVDLVYEPAHTVGEVAVGARVTF